MPAPTTTNNAASTVMNNPVASPVINSVTTVAPTTQQTQTTPEPPKGMPQKPIVARVLSLEAKGVSIAKQNTNNFPTVTINQEIPLEIRQNNKFLMDILGSGTISESIGIKQITKDTVEYEQ